MSEWFAPTSWFGDEGSWFAPESSVTKTVSKTVDWNLEGYRYFKTRLKTTDAAQTVVFRFTDSVSGEDKSYSIETGLADTFTEITIDLCLPDDLTDDDDGLDDDVYTQESRYPLTGGSTTPPSGSDATWGVNHVEEISVTFPSGQTLTVDYLSLVRHSSGFAEATWLPAFEPWKSVYTSTTGKSQFWTDADRRVADLTLQTLSGTTYSWKSITTHKADIAERLGWTTGTGGSLPADGYHTNSLEALIVGGGGWAWEWGTGWDSWINRNLTGSTNVVAQMLWDEAVGYPGIGKVWSAGVFGTPLELVAAKVKRGQAWGLVMKTTGDGETSGAIVELLTDPGAVSAGSGTSGDQGEYDTGTPFGKKESHKAVTGTVESPAFTVYDRMRHRRSFLRDLGATGVTYAVGADMAHYIAYVDVDGNVVTERSDNRLGFVSETQGFGADWVHLDVSKRKPYLVRLNYADAGTCYTRTSVDGITWSAAANRGTGTRMVSVELRDGGHFEYKYVAGDIEGQLYDSAGTAIGSSFTATTGVDDVQFDAHHSSQGNNSFRVVLVCVKSGSRTILTAPDGVTFS